MATGTSNKNMTPHDSEHDKDNMTDKGSMANQPTQSQQDKGQSSANYPSQTTGNKAGMPQTGSSGSTTTSGMTGSGTSGMTGSHSSSSSGMSGSFGSSGSSGRAMTGSGSSQGGSSRMGMTGGGTSGSSQGMNEPPEPVAHAIDDVSDKAKEVVDRASDSLKQTSANAAMSVQQAQQQMVDRAYDVKSQAAQQLRQAAQSLRSEVRSQTGQPVQQAEALARNLDNLGNYLEQRSFEDIESDLRHTIQRNPWQSVGVAVAVGWVLSRLFGGRR